MTELDDFEISYRKKLWWHIAALDAVDRSALVCAVVRTLTDYECQTLAYGLTMVMAERAAAAERGDRAPPGTPLN